MSTIALVAVALCLAVAGLLVAEWLGSRAGTWVAKPLASTLFIAIALLAGALETGFGQLILLGLALSWLGDVLLIPDGDASFVAGLSAFLLAHVAYTMAFLALSVEILPMVITSVPMLIVAAIVLRWLWPGMPKGMRVPVICYVTVIAVMVIVAGGTMPAWGPWLLVAAIVFAVSDIFVARERFVQASLMNRVWGLPLYYAAQCGFAFSVATP